MASLFTSSEIVAVRLAERQVNPARHRTLALEGWFHSVHGKWQWWHPGQLPPDLTTGDAFAWKAWEQAGLLTVVKASRRRVVGRLTGRTGDYYFKRFLTSDVVSRLQERWCGPSALHEALRLEQLRRAGVPTLELVAVGQPRGCLFPSESCLVTRGVKGGVSLSEFLPPLDRPWQAPPEMPERSQLVAALGELVGQLHGSGFLHGDLHAANILVRREPGGWKAWLIDLARLRRAPRAGSGSAWGDDLLRLSLSLHPWVNAADFSCFWTHYLARRCALDASFSPQTAANWQRACFSQVLSAWRKTDRVWARGNSQMVKTPWGRCVASWKKGGDVWQRRLIDQRNRLSADKLPSETPVTLPGADRACSLRQIRMPLVRRGLRGWSLARHCWELGHALRRRGVPTAVPCAYLDDPVNQYCYVLYQDPADVVSLAEWLRQRKAPQERRQIAGWIAHLLRRAVRVGLNVENLTAADLQLKPSMRWCGFRHLERLEWSTGFKRSPPDLGALIDRLLNDPKYEPSKSQAHLSTLRFDVPCG